MAIFYLRTSIVRSSSGKSAVASAAYQSATSLHDERLGKTFSYKNKEEVIHTEILLPENAPAEYKDRATLWNAVEQHENKSNSRYARQFIVAVPREWTKDEAIERSRDFIQKAFVDKGMAADWAFHMKGDNPHLHIMCTVRGFTKDGGWATMEKKAYALDPDGQRIPEIDPKTGEQKIRRRTRNGVVSEEKIWKRITVQANNWNKRSFLNETKKLWAEHCNQYLTEENQIDGRSYAEQNILKLPQVHEGPDARAAAEQGIIYDSVKENQERKIINEILKGVRELLHTAVKPLLDLKEKIKEWRSFCESENKRITKHNLRIEEFNKALSRDKEKLRRDLSEFEDNNRNLQRNSSKIEQANRELQRNCSFEKRDFGRNTEENRAIRETESIIKRENRDFGEAIKQVCSVEIDRNVNTQRHKRRH